MGAPGAAGHQKEQQEKYMGFFTKLFKIKRPETAAGNMDVDRLPEECRRLFTLKSFMEDCLSRDCYMAKSAYRPGLSGFQDVYGTFSVIMKQDLLKEYCSKHSIQVSDVEEVMKKYETFETLMDAHNETYIQKTMESEKEYLDGILKDVDPAVS